MWLIPSQILDKTQMRYATRNASLPSISLADLDLLAQNKSTRKALDLSKETSDLLTEIAANFGLRDSFDYPLKKLIRYIYVDGYSGVSWLLNKTLRSPEFSNDFLDIYASLHPRQRNKTRTERPKPKTFISMKNDVWEVVRTALRSDLRKRATRNKSAPLTPQRFSAQALGSPVSTPARFWSFNPSIRQNPSLFAPSSNYKNTQLFKGMTTSANPRFMECVMGLPIGWTSPLHKQVWLMSSYQYVEDILSEKTSAERSRLWLTPTVHSAGSGITLDVFERAIEHQKDYATRKRSGQLSTNEKPPGGGQESTQIQIARQLRDTKR